MLPELLAADATTTANPSTSAWLFLLGLLTCLLVIGHQLPPATPKLPLTTDRAEVPAQRVTTLPAMRRVVAPVSGPQYITISAVASPSAAL